jgi:lipopolysaccharide/colanic/teichoic acid biosynthesis glycosyltransferase
MRHTIESLAITAEADVHHDAPDSGLASLIADIHRTFDRRWSRRIAVDVVLAVDALLIVLAGLIPAFIYAKFYLAKGVPFLNEVSTPWIAIVQTGVIAAIIACGVLRHWGMYDSERVHDLPSKPLKLLGALAIAFIAVLGLGNPFSTAHPMLWIWSAAWMSASFTFLLGNRIASRALLRRWTMAGRFETRVAVFGAGTIARRVRDHLANPALGLRFVGVYDDRAEDGRVNPEGLNVTGRLDTLIKAARMGRVDRIVVALPQSADHRQTAVLRKLEALPVSVHMVTHIASDLVAVGSGHRVSNLGPVGLIDVKDRPLADWSPLLKRVEDYALGCVLLIASLPLLGLIWLAAKIESRAPALVSERRRGLDARVFKVWRFRTTRGGDADPANVLVDPAKAEEVQPVDQQLTRFGRVLRSSGLEKLPQLLNVVTGDMSLVGPAPYGLAEPCRYGQMLEDHANRYRMKPGMTGSTTAVDADDSENSGLLRARIEGEMADISHWTLGRDLRRLVQAMFGIRR